MIRDTALQFAKGPQGWIHGAAGNAFFSAKRELLMRSAPKDPHIFLQAIRFSSGLRFLFDSTTKEVELYNSWQAEDLSIPDATLVINSSPCCTYNKLTARFKNEGLYKKICCAIPKQNAICSNIYNVGTSQNLGLTVFI